MQNDYGYTTNPYSSQPNGKPKIGLGKFGFLIGGVVIVLIIIFFIFNLLFGGNSSRDSILAVVQQQQNIVTMTSLRVVEQADQATKNATVNTSASVASAQNRLTAAAGERGVSFKEKELEAGLDTTIEASLDSAAAAGTLSSTLQTNLSTELDDYLVKLQTVYNEVESQEMRELVQTLFDEATVLKNEFTKITARQ